MSLLCLGAALLKLVNKLRLQPISLADAAHTAFISRTMVRAKFPVAYAENNILYVAEMGIVQRESIAFNPFKQSSSPLWTTDFARPRTLVFHPSTSKKFKIADNETFGVETIATHMRELLVWRCPLLLGCLGDGHFKNRNLIVSIF